MPPRRPLVFAVGDADGNLHIYDLKRSRGCPEATLKVTRNRSPVYAIVFNPRSPQLLATADGEGFVKVWRLSGALSTMAPREQVCCAHDSLHSSVRVINSVGAAGAGIARQAGDSTGRRTSSGGRRCGRQRRVRLRWRGRVRLSACLARLLGTARRYLGGGRSRRQPGCCLPGT